MESSSTVAMVAALARAIELTGIAVMIVGGLVAVGAFLLRLVRPDGRRPAASALAPGATRVDGGRAGFGERYRELRADLGRAILLGLEFLVAGDIVGTVAIEPTFRTLGVLALIVAIRTFLSFTLELEITGRWPWQAPAPSSGTARPPGA